MLYASYFLRTDGPLTLSLTGESIDLGRGMPQIILCFDRSWLLFSVRVACVVGHQLAILACLYL